MAINSNKKQIKFAGLLLVAFFIFMQMFSINALAVDSNYLDVDNWEGNSYIKTVYIYKSSKSSTLQGNLKYFTDSANGCVYSYFSISESTLSATNNDVKVRYKVTQGDSAYYVSVNASGVINGVSDVSSIQNFNYYTSGKRGVYISGIEFSDKKVNRTVSINISINGNDYKDITKSFTLSAATTTKVSKTTTAKSAKTTTSATTKNATTKSAGKVTTTAYKASASATSAATTQYKAQSTTTAASSATIDDSVINNTGLSIINGNANSHMSTAAKILLGVGIFIVAVGVILIIVAAVYKGNKDKEQQTDKK